MFYDFLKGCIGFMVNDFWARYLIGVGKEIAFSVILAVIFGLIIGLVALVAWPIAGGAAALAILLSPTAIEMMLCALIPMMVGVVMLGIYCAFWVGTAAVMLTGVIVMGTVMAAYELGCGVVKLCSFLFGSKTPTVSHVDDVRLTVFVVPRADAFSSALPPALPSSQRSHHPSTVEGRQTSNFFPPVNPDRKGQSGAPASTVTPIAYPPTFAGYEPPKYE